MTEETLDGTASEPDDPEEEVGLFPVGGVWFKVGFYLVILAWMGYVLGKAAGFTREQDWLFPFVIGVPIVLLILVKLVTIRYPALVERLVPEGGAGSDMFAQIMEESTRPRTERERYELYLVAWLVVLPVMMFVIGMGWTLLIYTFAFTWFFTRNLRTAGVVTVGVFLFIWILFVEILSMVIWDGLLGLVGPFQVLNFLLGR